MEIFNSPFRSSHYTQWSTADFVFKQTRTRYGVQCKICQTFSLPVSGPLNHTPKPCELWFHVSLPRNDSGEKLVCGWHGCFYLSQSFKHQATDPSKASLAGSSFWKNKTKSKTKTEATSSGLKPDWLQTWSGWKCETQSVGCFPF